MYNKKYYFQIKSKHIILNINNLIHLTINSLLNRVELNHQPVEFYI